MIKRSDWAFLVSWQMQNESWSRKPMQQPEHPADALTGSWEDISNGRKVSEEASVVLVIQISMRHISNIFTVSLSASFQLLTFVNLCCHQPALCEPWRRQNGMQGPALGLDQSALQWFLLFGLCTFPDAHHTRCILNVDLCESSLLACSQRQHYIRGSELLSPKITRKTWEHNTQRRVTITATALRVCAETEKIWRQMIRICVKSKPSK